MSSDIRLRRHTDGRWAVHDHRGGWWVSDDAPGGPPILMSAADVRDRDGWSELFVAKLPEPTKETVTVLGVRRVTFGPVTATINPDGGSWIGNGVFLWGNPQLARETAAGLLAATDVCERYRAAREETG